MQLINKLATLLSIVFVAFNVNSSEAQEATPPQKLEKTLLWKVTGKGIKPAYLFGTIHMIGSDDFFWNKNMEKAFKKSKKLVMEIDMSQMLATSMQMMKLAPMEGEQKLKDLISEEDYTMVKKYFTEEITNPQAKMTPFAMIENWKPMLLQSFLYTEMIEGPVKMYEMFLTTKAQKAEMNFGGLETVADQMAVFNDIPYKKQAEMLVEMIENIKAGNDGANEFEKMVKHYKNQDVDGMLEAMQGDLDEMEGQEALLDNRNKNWIPQILEMSKKEKVFYAVGAGHLGGPNGVIRLLRKKGLKVKPVL